MKLSRSPMAEMHGGMGRVDSVERKTVEDAALRPAEIVGALAERGSSE